MKSNSAAQMKTFRKRQPISAATQWSRYRTLFANCLLTRSRFTRRLRISIGI